MAASVKAASKQQKPEPQDEAGQLSDALRENRLLRTLLHEAMEGNSNRLSSSLDGVTRGPEWPEIVTI